MSVTSIESCLSQWQRAFSAKDPVAICALYADDANLWGTLSATRRDSALLIRQYFDSLFAYTERRVEFVEYHVRVIAPIAIASGSYRFQWRDDQGIVDTVARFSLVFRLQKGRWLIVEHHSSVPPEVASIDT